MKCLSLLCVILIIIGVASGIQISITGLPDDSWKYRNQNNRAGRLTKTFNHKIKDNELDKQMELGCVLSGNISRDSIYSISFDGKNKRVQFQESKQNSETLSSIIRLTNENKTIICTATKTSDEENNGIGNVLSAELHFYYIPPPPTTTSTSEPPCSVPVTTSGIQISITGLPDDSWKYRNQNNRAGRLTKTFNHKIKDNELDKQMELGCVLSGNISRDSIYSISFDGKNKRVQFQESKQNSETLSSIIRLTNENKTIICTATKTSDEENNGIGNVLSAELHFYYIPPPPTTTSTSEPPCSVPVTTLMWSLVVLAAVAVIIFIAFTITYLRLRKTVAVLEEKERLWNRAPLQTPNEDAYEPVYGHGAGLLRRPK